MKIYYDLHIHSGLSPCGDEDMTPNNIVNMSIIKGLNVIAVTDHNSVSNYCSIKKVADKANLVLICGMEVTTKEEIHILCYFKNYDSAKKVSDLIYDSLPDMKYCPDYFGYQNIYDENDEIIGNVDKLLISASKYSLIELNSIVAENDGVIVPAHVNKLSDGLLGVLGFYPDSLKCRFVEIKRDIPYDLNISSNFGKYNTLYNSDAHYLKDISEPESYFELNKPTDIFDILF